MSPARHGVVRAWSADLLHQRTHRTGRMSVDQRPASDHASYRRTSDATALERRHHSFGLVTIPVRLYSATRSLAPAFHLVHRECGSRIREQLYCPKHKRVVSREEPAGLRDRQGPLRDLHARGTGRLEATGPRTIDIQQFVPLRTVDPIFFESTAYLGPDRDGDKPFRLLAEVMRDRDEVALGTYVTRGKERLVAIRPYRDGPGPPPALFRGRGARVRRHRHRKGPGSEPGGAEVGPAPRRGAQAAGFRSEGLRGHLPRARRSRPRARRRGAGRSARSTAPPRRGAVVDLMDALQRSLAGPARRTASRKGALRGARRSAAAPVRLKAG